MTVEEMIYELAYNPLETCSNVYISKEKAEKIIAALKAGKAVAEKLRLLHEGGDIRGITKKHDDILKHDVEQILDLWDDAT